MAPGALQIEQSVRDGLASALGGAAGPFVLLGGVRAVRGRDELGKGRADLSFLDVQLLGLSAVLGDCPLEHLAGAGAVVMKNPGGQTLQRGRAVGESGGERCGEDGDEERPVADDSLAHGGDEGTLAVVPQGGAGGAAPASPGGHGGVVLTGKGVEDGGEELAAEDLLGPQVGRRRGDASVEEPAGVLQDR